MNRLLSGMGKLSTQTLVVSGNVIEDQLCHSSISQPYE